MRTALLMLTIALAVLPTVARADTPAPRVMIVGDSHIERLGPMMSRAVQEDGLESLGSLARRGWSTARYVREGDLQQRLTENGTPDIVIISLGGNDRPRNMTRYREQLAWVVGQVREAGATRIIWLGPAASDMARSERARMVGEWHEHNADWQSQILPEMGVEWLDSRDFTHTGHGMDGIHFTVRAYRSWCHAALQAAHIEPAPAVANAA